MGHDGEGENDDQGEGGVDDDLFGIEGFGRECGRYGFSLMGPAAPALRKR